MTIEQFNALSPDAQFKIRIDRCNKAKRAYLKYTFSSAYDLEAICSNYPKKGKRKVRGQWVVQNLNDHDRVVFHASTTEECSRFIDEENAKDLIEYIATLGGES